MEKKIYDYEKHNKLQSIGPEEFFVDLNCTAQNLKVRGDIRIQFYSSKPEEGKKSKQLFHLWLNTAFVETNYLCFGKAQLDKLNKDKHHKKVDPNFRLEIFLSRVSDEEEKSSAEVMEQMGTDISAEDQEEDENLEDDDIEEEDD